MQPTLLITASLAAIWLGLAPPETEAAVPNANRVWVSGKGADAAVCGAPTTPCRSLQYAHDHAVVAGGEIDVLDPAGYGAVTITKALSIVNDGVGTAGVQATSGAAITIEAGQNDSVYLRGLNIDGAQNSAASGVQFNSGAGLTVVNCVVRHFSLYGIVMAPGAFSARVLVANTLLSDIGGMGFAYAPSGGGPVSVTGTLDHVVATNDEDGVLINANNVAGGSMLFAIVDSDLNGNTAAGLEIDDPASHIVVNVDNTHMDLEGNVGLFADGVAAVHLTRSVLDQNTYAIHNGTIAPGGVYSTGDNRMEANTHGPVSGAALLTDPLN